MKRIAAVVFLLVSAAGFAGRAYAIEPSGSMSRDELKTLVATASTPADHMKLANYFHYEANQLQAQVKEHEEMGADYDKNPVIHPIPKAQTLGDHCRNLAKFYSEAARRSEQMAKIHEQMAKASH